VWLIVVCFFFCFHTNILSFLLFLLVGVTGTDHLVDGGKKDATFISSLFDPWIQKLDPDSTRIDCVFFDGASNVQKAGQLLAAKYPRIHVQHCAAHSVSLFFSDISKKLWQFRLLLVNYRRLYRLFGSGSMHSPYALFVQQSKNFNGGRKVGLLKAADTRMAGHSYAQCRMLRLREPLMATISSAAYKALRLKGFPKKVEAYLSNPDMWEAAYSIQRCVFPMIRCLRLSDKSACGGMSKIVFYVHKTDEAIAKSMELLRDLQYFKDYQAGDLDELPDWEHPEWDDNEREQSAAEEEEDDTSSTISGDERVDELEGLHLGEKLLYFWNKRREKLITPLSLAGWFCSPIADIRKDVKDNEIGANRLDIELVIGKLYYPMRDAELGQIIQTFWREFDLFQTKQGASYSRPWIWDSEEIKTGNCHLWHKIYSVPFTTVFGKVACRVTSKPLGCGLAERNWGALKHLKGGKRSHISGDKAQKQATIYGAACMDKSRAAQLIEERNGVLLESAWSDADIAFQMGLENWDTVAGIIPGPIRPKRLFHAWLEDWEFDCIHHRDCVSEARLLQKYGGLKWMDPDEKVLCVAKENRMDYQGGRNGAGWCVIAEQPGNDNPVADEDLEPWVLHVVVDLIAEYTQDDDMNVEIVVNESNRAANDQRILEEQELRKERSRRGARRRS
jgi:hypothetical protein